MALVYKDLELDLSDIKKSDKEEVKKKVADLLRDEILRHVGKGKSPVSGEPKNFKILNPIYAKKEKQGNKTPNLQLEGDLLRDDLDAIGLSDVDVVRVGHFKEKTADTEGEKADGHNQHTVKAQIWAQSKGFPRRRYIPSESQTFNADILTKVENIIKPYKVTDKKSLVEDEIEDIINSLKKGGPKVTVVADNEEITAVSLDDVLSDDFIEALIRRRLADDF